MTSITSNIITNPVVGTAIATPASPAPAAAAVATKAVTASTTTTNNFAFLSSPVFWTNAAIVILVLMCGYLLYSLIFMPRMSVRTTIVSPGDNNWSSTYGNFFNGVYSFTYNGAPTSMEVSYPVLNNKQVGIKISSLDASTIIYAGFNEISALIDTISNSYYDPNLQNITDISTILAQTKLILPTRAIQANAIVDTNTGSFKVWFSLDNDANVIMNITYAAQTVSGSSVLITPGI